MRIVTLMLAITSFGTSAVAKMKRTNDNCKLYAYGSGIGGLSLQYSEGLLYVIQGDQSTSGYAPVNFSTTSTSVTSGGTVSIASETSSNDTSAIGDLLAVAIGTNAAVQLVGNASSSETTTDWTFFGSILTYSGTTSKFFAVPIDVVGIFQIYWLDDASTATNGSQPVALKKTAPATLANPANPGNPNAPSGQ